MRTRKSREEDFHLLIKRYYPRVKCLVARKIRYEEDRLDLIQEIFMITFKSLESFRGDSRLGTWVYRIAINHCHRYLEKARTDVLRSQSLDERGDDAGRLNSAEGRLAHLLQEPGSQLDSLLLQERLRVCREAIENLPPQMKRCVKLRIEHGFKHQEIARLLQVSEETVKAQISRAIPRLQAELERAFKTKQV